MRAKLDENLPAEAAELLRTAGWERDTVHDEGLAGADDPKVAAACQADARVRGVVDMSLLVARISAFQSRVPRRDNKSARFISA